MTVSLFTISFAASSNVAGPDNTPLVGSSSPKTTYELPVNCAYSALDAI